MSAAGEVRSLARIAHAFALMILKDGEELLCRNQGDAMSKLFEEMAKGTAEARAYMQGKRKGYKVTLPETVDVRGIRKRLRLSQERFADRFGLSVDCD